MSQGRFLGLGVEIKIEYILGNLKQDSKKLPENVSLNGLK